MRLGRQAFTSWASHSPVTWAVREEGGRVVPPPSSSVFSLGALQNILGSGPLHFVRWHIHRLQWDGWHRWPGLGPQDGLPASLPCLLPSLQQPRRLQLHTWPRGDRA